MDTEAHELFLCPVCSEEADVQGCWPQEGWAACTARPGSHSNDSLCLEAARLSSQGPVFIGKVDVVALYQSHHFCKIMNLRLEYHF